MSRYPLLVLLAVLTLGVGVFVMEGTAQEIRETETRSYTLTPGEIIPVSTTEVESPVEATQSDTGTQKTAVSNVVEELEHISETIQYTEEEARKEEERLHTETEQALKEYAENVLEAIQKSATSTPVSPGVLEHIQARELELREELKAVVEQESARLQESVRTENTKLRQESRERIIAETQSRLREFTNIARERALQVERAEYEARVKKAVSEFEEHLVANEIVLKERVGLKLFRDTD